jgi:hypothetical protein
MVMLMQLDREFVYIDKVLVVRGIEVRASRHSKASRFVSMNRAAASMEN